jgi:hypothetical protein
MVLLVKGEVEKQISPLRGFAASVEMTLFGLALLVCWR